MHFTSREVGEATNDPLVTDIQTAPPDQIDPVGGVLHEATGNVDLLMIAVDNGADRMVYVGPVMSHYEFQLGPTTRQTDSEWKTQIRAGNAPPVPDWTRTYWVPGTFAFPWWIN